MKRYLYLAHRWLGIALGLFVLLWIVSGVVMLFVGYPKLTPEEHLSRLQPLSGDCCVAPGAALAASADPRTPLSLRLTGAGGSPRYLLDYGDGPLLVVDARSGKRIEHIGAAEALASARQFADGAEVRLLDQVEEDAWTRNHALARERPLYRVQADDAEGRLLYVSSHTGLVVRDATAHERAWNLLGAWLHWLYPLREVMPKALWSVALVYGALLAAVLVLLGMLIGLLRWRFAGRYRNGSHSPYPTGAGRVHHVGGLLAGVVLLVWLVSGMLSMEPWGLFEKRSTIEAAALRSTPLNAEAVKTDLVSALARFREADIEPVELQWHMLGEQPYLVGLDSRGETRILPVASAGPAQEHLERAVLERQVREAWPEQPLHFDWLEQEDFHYYARSEPSLYSHLPRRLPLLRVRFDDPAVTWLHIDPYSGTVIEQLDQRRRAVRWVFKLLHSWDWLPLLQRPLLRDGLLLAFSAGMLAIAVSGVLLGWRRLRARPRRARARTVRAVQPPRLP
ncbi:Na+/proline symporter [Stutzerimonas stutzeri ATCC 14405 = CCUG 16156]|uniref:PepSY domain-containing protein n=1 Tax=Stutzerimonas stutzeri TaxID=316 RepID=UPI000254993F|nr:PepSY domain-containing protein [Stutzerimonas stutzeri]EHY77308.1 Na+/proline symporter [Stutzerimonas stutzeri ATCC 14405 = CCUG 16156]MDH2243101.1 PepSY domain-containing protein [Pseudomonas sp. GD03909]QOZ93885.1 PepSY domain-containing protein [Stutzerimonas stutzeri]